MCFILEYMAGGDLLHFLRKTKKEESTGYVTTMLPEKELIKYAYDIVSGMAHIASQKVYRF